jgi:hypothetical protein
MQDRRAMLMRGLGLFAGVRAGGVALIPFFAVPRGYRETPYSEEALSPDSALCLPTFSHFFIVN